jgi:hypothetical protein
MEACQTKIPARVVDQLKSASLALGGGFLHRYFVVICLEFWMFFNSTRMPSQDVLFSLVGIRG